MIGETILHYKILEKLGEGGMGIVYKAQDTKLDRFVALKFLPSQITASEEDKARLIQEAKAASAINHPNVCTIYSIEEYGKQLFIVMEFVEGKELKEIIQTHGDASLPLNNIINYAEQIAEGLKAAHEKGIIHRDIKPANILINDKSEVKIMDFGLATIGNNRQFTKAETTAGTVSYMSPEQLKAVEADHRTDIWSFGIVLYEMITGKSPFEGAYEQSISYSIVNEIQIPVSNYRNDIPKELLFILDKCLSKNAGDRYNNVDELLQALHEIHGKSAIVKSLEKYFSIKNRKKRRVFAFTAFAILFATAVLIIWNFTSKSRLDDNKNNLSLKRIAVLPFTNINNDKDVNFLSFALADQIISSLAYINHLIVRPSSLIRPYQNKVVDPAAVAKKLNVDYILSGSYQKELDEIRLNLQLINIKSNNLVWHDTIQVKYENAFKLQDIVSEKVINGLELKFNPAKNNVKRANIPNDPSAYEYFLRAVSYPMTNKNNLAAIGLLLKSIKIDSNFAPAYSELGFRYHILATYDPTQRDKLDKAINAYEKAISINDKSLSALANLASLYTEIGKDADAIQLIKKSLKINPNNAAAHFWLGYIYRYTGQLNKAAEEMETAINLDPSNPRFRSIGATYLYQGRYREAILGFNLDKGSPYSMAFKGQVYFRLGEIDSAKKYLTKSIKIEPEGTLGNWSKVMLYFIENKRQAGLKTLKELETSGVHDAEQIYNYANLYGLYDDKKNCIRLLKEAIDKGFYCYPYMLHDSFLDPVRKDKEFQKILTYAEKKYEEFKKFIDD